MRWRLAWLDEADSGCGMPALLLILDDDAEVDAAAGADADADGSRWAASLERRAASRRATYRELRR